MKKLQLDFKAAYVPLPPEMIEARKAGLLMLLQWIREDLILNPIILNPQNVTGDIKEPSSPAKE